jgi:hypothetical protein
VRGHQSPTAPLLAGPNLPNLLADALHGRGAVA